MNFKFEFWSASALLPLLLLLLLLLLPLLLPLLPLLLPLLLLPPLLLKVFSVGAQTSIHLLIHHEQEKNIYQHHRMW
jgi:hypothetical protein